MVPYEIITNITIHANVVRQPLNVERFQSKSHVNVMVAPKDPPTAVLMWLLKDRLHLEALPSENAAPRLGNFGYHVPSAQNWCL